MGRRSARGVSPRSSTAAAVALAAVVVAAAICCCGAAVSAAGEAALPAAPVYMSSLQQQQHTAWMAAQRPSCRALYAARRFLSPEEQAGMASRVNASSWCPALLWTYPGSGNTMLRMMVEVASGWLTGSVYDDASLAPILPGESASNHNATLAVKAHPSCMLNFAPLTRGGSLATQLGAQLGVCAFTRAAAVVRNPYLAILAEYQRQRTESEPAPEDGELGPQVSWGGGHVATISRDEFNARDFSYQVMRMTQQWVKMFDMYEEFAAAYPGGFYLTTFESFVEPNKTRASEALAQLLTVLGVPPSRNSTEEPHAPRQQPPGDVCSTGHADGSSRCGSGGNNGSQPHTHGALHASHYDPDRLACAFEMASHPAIRRPKRPDAIDAQFAYGSNPDLVCRVWAVVGERAAAHGYTPFGGIQC